MFNWICVYFWIQMRSVVSSVSKVHTGFLSSWFWNACIWVGEMHLFTRGDLQSDSRWLGSCFGIQFPIEPGLAKDLFKFACSCLCVCYCVIGRWLEIVASLFCMMVQLSWDCVFCELLETSLTTATKYSSPTFPWALTIGGVAHAFAFHVHSLHEWKAQWSTGAS